MFGKRILAQPALAGTGIWTVEDSGSPGRGSADFGQMLMLVPTQDDELGRFIRAHEVMHSRITPPDGGQNAIADGADAEAIQAPEDCRVNSRLVKECGIKPPSAKHPLIKASIAGFMEVADKMEVYDLAKNALHFTHCPQQRVIDATIRKRFPAIIDQVNKWRRRLRPGSSFQDTFTVTMELQTLRTVAEMPPGMMFDDDSHIPKAKSVGLTFEKIIYHELERPICVEEMQHQVRRMMDTGIVPRHFHRLFTDGAIFSRKVKRPGANAIVVMDCSGSMASWNQEAIPEILTEAGATEIIGYTSNGNPAPFAHFSDGEYMIDVSGGMPEPFHTGGNRCDGAVLERCAALALSSGKRLIWISDGAVSASGESRKFKGARVSALDYCESVIASVGGIRLHPEYVGLDGIITEILAS